MLVLTIIGRKDNKMIKTRVLRHKIFPTLFGVLKDQDEGEIRQADVEIYQCDTPQLFGKDATIKDLQHLLNNTTALKQLENYNLVDATITINS